MNDQISRQAAIDQLHQSYNLLDAERRLEDMPSAQPDNQVNLCDSCKHTYPDCPSQNDDVIFGNGNGDDNICACAKYAPSAQPDVVKDTNVPCKDAISRQAAIDAANNWLLDCFKVQKQDRSCGLIRRLEELPSAQSEIIRCKDCKHYQFADNRAFGMPVKMCEWFGFEDVDDDDFCSRAERREEGGAE